MSTYHPRSRRYSGFTLIEVAIALALFVVGALAIVRIFPPALNVIRNNESRVTATQLGESTLSKLRTKGTPPPEAIFDVDSAGNWQDYPAAIVSSASKGNTLPATPIEPDYDRSALGNFRYIYGEPHYIRAGQTVLLNNKLSRPFDASVNITAFYYEIVEGVQIESDGDLDFSNAYLKSDNSKFSDPANPTLPPTDHRTEDDVIYYVSYRWRECSDINCTNDPPIKGVIEEPMGIADLAMSARVLATTTNSGYRVIPGTAQVRLRKIASAPTVVANKILASATSPGVYYFNYLSTDWRDMIFDSGATRKSGVPDTNPILPAIIRLPIGGLDTDYPIGNSGIVSSSWSHSDNDAGDTITPTNVERKTGEVEYPFSRSDWQHAPRFRTVYRTADNWAQQLSVAPRSYIPYDSNRGSVNFPREPWREYHWSDADPGILYFHPSEAGKTISIKLTHNTGGILRTIDSISTIEDDLINQPGSVANGFMGSYLDPVTGTTATNTRVARVFITDVAGNPVNATSILSISGLSIRARTAWLNSDRYNQVIVPGYRPLTQTG